MAKVLLKVVKKESKGDCKEIECKPECTEKDEVLYELVDHSEWGRRNRSQVLQINVHFPYGWLFPWISFVPSV